MIAFLIPNEKTNRPLTDFAVSVDKIENLTGYDFFSQLPDDEETQLEGKVILAGWFKGYEEPDREIQNTKPVVEPSLANNHFYLILILALCVVILFIYLKGKRK